MKKRNERGQFAPVKYDPSELRKIEKTMYKRVKNDDDPSTIITDAWLKHKHINIFMLLKLYRGVKYQIKLQNKSIIMPYN